MKLRIISVALATLMLGLACSKSPSLSDTTEPSDTTPLTADNSYDELMSNLAQAVNKAAINSPEFRQIVHQQVNLQFDGDYDLLLQTAAPIQITPTVDCVTRSDGSFSIGDMLEQYYPEQTTRSSDKSIIEELTELYPNLQIAVPVHAEEWNPEEFTPKVCFIPSDYVDLKTETIPGYDAEGNPIVIDAINEPDEPVIVIGLSERAGSNVGTGGWGDGGSGWNPPVQLPAPEVSGTYTNNTVVLTWTQSLALGGSIYEYKIYRADLTGNSEYEVIATVDASVRTYTDRNVTPNRSYAYKVTGMYGLFMPKDSAPIVIETNYTKPKPVSNLVVDAIGMQRLKIEWENPDNEFYTTRIERLSGNDNKPYEVVATIDPQENIYLDTDVDPGVRYTYRVRKVDNQGRLSDALQGYSYATFRNPDAPSKVYLKQITCNLNLVEGWPLGKPEFEIKVAGMDEKFQTSELSHGTYVQFASRSGTSQIFNNVLLHNWSYFNHLTYYPALTFAMQEVDYDSAVQMHIKVAVATKVATAVDIQANLEIPVRFSNEGEYCGACWILYFEDPETWMDYPRNEARMLISEEP